ncbi:hypothetical protein C1645_838697 [Glomus cerebriforme]|uniref:Uncharacterized protein n=1 Tax=Glomus cerebriforme TaxID=658196 RepID=A0A397S1Y0_9GLOM|nr:hypothetical protein C1645_838697 [Glomus cerebriforme]
MKNLQCKNGPGCKTINKPIIVHKQIADIKERKFELFFADKANNEANFLYSSFTKWEIQIL